MDGDTVAERARMNVGRPAAAVRAGFAAPGVAGWPVDTRPQPGCVGDA
ncbi:MAG: hypothetical protein RQ833_05665 [Sphingomonadaceae bacterium]|nr:hypothetical protein [Sphingomonadaceae bacterium]